VFIDIKFCSNPNALNCKKKGKNPVTVFGGDGFEVNEIDIDSLRLCLAADPTICTPRGPQAWSMADRGDPTTDLGADCEGGGNPDGYMDLDAAFDAREVIELVGCSTLSKRDVTATLVITGTLQDGTGFISEVRNDVGVDQYLVQNK
jgi:hypothetical protein